jgi:hypothetical protein
MYLSLIENASSVKIAESNASPLLGLCATILMPKEGS